MISGSGGSQTTEGYKRSSREGTYTTTPTGISQYQTQFAQGYNDLYNAYNKLAGTPLKLQSAPIYSSGLDPIVQNVMSKGVQDIGAKQAQEARQTSNILSTAGTGSNSALLNVLNRQSALSGAGAVNQLRAGALEQQRQQDIQRQSMLDAINKNLILQRQTQIGELGSKGSLLAQIIEMAKVARGEKKTVKEKERIDYKETTDKNLF